MCSWARVNPISLGEISPNRVLTKLIKSPPWWSNCTGKNFFGAVGLVFCLSNNLTDDAKNPGEEEFIRFTSPHNGIGDSGGDHEVDKDELSKRHDSRDNKATKQSALHTAS